MFLSESHQYDSLAEIFCETTFPSFYANKEVLEKYLFSETVEGVIKFETIQEAADATFAQMKLQDDIENHLKDTESLRKQNSFYELYKKINAFFRIALAILSVGSAMFIPISVGLLLGYFIENFIIKGILMIYNSSTGKSGAEIRDRISKAKALEAEYVKLTSKVKGKDRARIDEKLYEIRKKIKEAEEIADKASSF
jgi:hypothetical protein